MDGRTDRQTGPVENINLLTTAASVIMADYLRKSGKIKCLQCFDAAGWTAGRASGLQKTEWWDAGVVICLGQDADLHIPS